MNMAEVQLPKKGNVWVNKAAKKRGKRVTTPHNNFVIYISPFLDNTDKPFFPSPLFSLSSA